MDKKEKKGLWSKINDNVKVAIFRWWFVGAIYFFVAWGTNLGLNNPLDLMFVLGVVCGACNIFIFNPIVYGMFEIERKGKIINKKYYNRTILEGVALKLAEIFKCLAVSCLVLFTYVLINLGMNKILGHNPNNIPLVGEPILYATFFLIYYSLLGWVYSLLRNLIASIKRRREQNNE